MARPGAHFPDPRRLDAHLGFLGPTGSRGLHDEVLVDPASGLPAVTQLLGVRADREVARTVWRDPVGASPEKRAYYEALQGAELTPAASVDVRLRRRAGATTHLEVVHDRLDAASGTPLRYTAHIAQKGARPVGFKDEETPEPTKRFVTLMERHSGADAELAFLLLSDLRGVKVEEVVRGQVGPLHFAGMDVPALLAPVFAEVPGAFVLHLVFERAAAAVAEERSRDPLARGYREALSGEARELVEAQRRKLGYRVARERRFVCTPAAEGALRTALARAGHAVVVRSA